jgi:aminopeptidase N
MNWEIYLHNFSTRSEFPDQLMSAVRNENNPLTLDYLINCLQTVYWNFLSENQRILLQETLENVLYQGMTESADPSLRRIFYDGYTAVAQSDSGLKNLRKLWSEELKEFGLPLSENDKIRLTLQLVIREVSGAQEIAEIQLVQVLNPDNKRRLEFLLPAVSGDETTRGAFFQSLLQVDNRDQEPWVSEALSYLHHPLRSESSLRYLKPGLEIIEEIKETGDIFFPKAWLDASLGGHHSEEAAGIVRDFLEQHPDLPIDLRNKILQSADILFRINKGN